MEQKSSYEQFSHILNITEHRKKFKIILKSFLQLRRKALHCIDENISICSIQSSLKLSDDSYIILKSLSDTKCLLIFYDNVVLGNQELTDRELIQIYKNL